tara:strand:- start:330 stop:1031 length:702 start_codon:yes stop_codon:yes gene_type:complete
MEFLKWVVDNLKPKNKMRLKNVVFLLVLLKMCITFGQNLDTKKRIVIDVGHGGKDPGAIGINNIQEKEVVLNIAKEMVWLNTLILDKCLDLYLTRYCDTFISLSDRGRLAKLLRTDLFISIHCNAAKTMAGGMEVFVHNSKHKAATMNLRASIDLGVSILHEGTKNLNLYGRGIKFANFQVLRETIGFCPAVLVETGFVTNVDEADYFLKPKNIRALALAILLGITKYFNMEL